MDLKISEGADWKRVKPDQAGVANRRRKGNKTLTYDEQELVDLLGEDTEEDTEDE